jgi:hypothetical protein
VCLWTRRVFGLLDGDKCRKFAVSDVILRTLVSYDVNTDAVLVVGNEMKSEKKVSISGSSLWLVIAWLLTCDGHEQTVLDQDPFSIRLSLTRTPSNPEHVPLAISLS